MEGSFQQDKRSVLAQQDALTRQLQEERERWEEEREELCGRIQEVSLFVASTRQLYCWCFPAICMHGNTGHNSAKVEYTCRKAK